MATEEILDSVRRIVHKWVNTITPITNSINAGDREIEVRRSYRFESGDEVVLKDGEIYETNLVIEEILDERNIRLNREVTNDWTVEQNSQLLKTINNNFVRGIYIGDPEVISRYPAITVNGTSRSSEWMTLESTKEKYNIEIGVFVKASSHEQGYRFLLQITDIIQKGLKRNLIPLVNDYNIISLVENITSGDFTIHLNNVEKVRNDRRIIIEDDYNFQENWVTHIYDHNSSNSDGWVHLYNGMWSDFDKDETSIIVPKRFVFNSWPSDIDYGYVHKGDLLKAAVIKWFAEEEEIQYLRRDEPLLK